MECIVTDLDLEYRNSVHLKLYSVCVLEGQNHFCCELLLQVCQPLSKNLFTQKKVVGERWKGREEDSIKVPWPEQRRSILMAC